jgi:hypothetical protein
MGELVGARVGLDALQRSPFSVVYLTTVLAALYDNFLIDWKGFERKRL